MFSLKLSLVTILFLPYILPFPILFVARISQSSRRLQSLSTELASDPMGRIGRLYSTNPFRSESEDASSCTISGILMDYFSVLRPVTILQAVGALLIGHLVLLSDQISSETVPPLRIIAGSASVYLSYGCGMLMNDLVDADTDHLHKNKKDRAVASGRISLTSGWIYCAGLVTISLLFGNCVGGAYMGWVAGNLGTMILYALGCQKVFLLKNIICGLLAVSPLVGASFMTEASAAYKYQKLWSLAAVGFPMQLAREILKDIEDTDIDRDRKMTLPMVMGDTASRKIAYGIVAINFSIIILTPVYWKLFAHKIPIFPIGVIISASMCIKAALISLKEGQKLLKKSIYVLLVAMMGALSFR